MQEGLTEVGKIESQGIQWVKFNLQRNGPKGGVAKKLSVVRRIVLRKGRGSYNSLRIPSGVIQVTWQKKLMPAVIANATKGGG